ncbi:hypothetical protein [Kitasatospora sp. NPDC058046]|uniref:hypothetical protein n=1 Tax=Kitasatospora sp. NPDC058046 TaxID=3346312 RepID=UPI0036DA3DCB
MSIAMGVCADVLALLLPQFVLLSVDSMNSVSCVAVDRWSVPDSLWDSVELLLSVARVRTQGGGRANLDDEAVLATIVHVLTSGCA